MNPDTTHSETGKENHSLADFTINRLHEAIEIANKSADDQMFQKRQAEAEVARLRAENSQLQKELTKFESKRLEIEDINGWIDSEFQIANKRALKSEAEVARLRAEVQRAIEDRNRIGIEIRGEYLPKLKDQASEVARLREALELIASPMRPDGTYNRERRACELLAKEALAPAPEEPVIQNSRITEPKWREFKNDQEEVQVGDECWSLGMWLEITQRTVKLINELKNGKSRFRTCRQLPKQERTPPRLDAEIEVIDTPSTYSVTEARHATADAIRYLRDEIQKLKTETNYHHESYCRKCNEPK